MALPTLDSVFASAANVPRKYMLAQWLVNELGSGAIADYVTFPERYLWAKIAVAAGAPLPEANYISLPKQYAWSDIYNAVAGSSLGTIDWSEKQALGHIAAAYRGDTNNPANLATYIDWPWRYQVASIIGGINPTFPSNGLLAFWKLADLTDASGNGNTLTNTNGVTFGAGKIGNAAQFDGSNYLSINTVAGFNPSNDYSISFWAKPSVLVDFFTLIGNADPPSFNIHSSASGNLNLNNASSEDVNVADVFTANNWVHVVATRNSENADIYKNGISVYSNPFTATYGVPADLSIGGLSTNGSFFITGQMDAVGIWNRALSEPEITQLYNNGNGVEP